MRGWIGCDLDGTLAIFDGWFGFEHIGEPIPAMVALVKALRSEGQDVRIFTARVSHDPDGIGRAAIQRWCVQHLGEVLPVTCVKDFSMIRLYDDRAVQVLTNTGILVGPVL